MLEKRKQDIYLILDNIRSTYNVGAIFRTADAAGIKKLYLCGITAHPPRKDIEKTALGTTESVCWEYRDSTKELINNLKEQNVYIIALEQTDSSIDYRKEKYFPADQPLAIMVGNELNGIDKKVIDLCNVCVEIPMQGKAHSLNVATAVGIILFKVTE